MHTNIKSLDTWFNGLFIKKMTFPVNNIIVQKYCTILLYKYSLNEA